MCVYIYVYTPTRTYNTNTHVLLAYMHTHTHACKLTGQGQAHFESLASLPLSFSAKKSTAATIKSMVKQQKIAAAVSKNAHVNADAVKKHTVSNVKETTNTNAKSTKTQTQVKKGAVAKPSPFPSVSIWESPIQVAETVCSYIHIHTYIHTYIHTSPLSDLCSDRCYVHV